MNNYFQTSDLALASAIYLFKPIESIDKSNPTRIVFSFERSNDLDCLVESFWRGELQGDLRKYFDSIKAIKSLIHQN